MLVAAAITGVVSSLLAPLGPVTTGQALAVMVVGLLLGLLGGAVTGTAWAVVPVAAVHVLAVELVRAGADLPTVQEIRLDSYAGVIAFLAARGLHGLLLVLPMVLGARLGTGIVRRRAGAAPPRRRGLVATALVAVLVVGLAALVVRPASTPPVLGPDGEPVAGSVAELDTVRLGGDEHAVLLRASDPDDPVLLYLSGGPGQSDLALSRVLSAPWVEDVVFATFDQRGNGKSYPALLPAEEATLDQAVADVIELTDHLRTRFDEDKIYLMGESWGTLLGVLAVQQRPDLFHAYLGSGQMVNVRETDQRIYADLQAYAEESGNGGLARMVDDVGEPPYADIPWANGEVMFAYDYLYDDYTPSEGYLERGTASGLDPFGVKGTEYTFVEKAGVLRGLVDTFSVMYPQIQDLDLRESAPRMEVPVYMLDGAAELDGRRDLALQWYDQLEAPAKQIVTYPNAAHAVAFEQADDVHRLLVEEVIPATYPAP